MSLIFHNAKQFSYREKIPFEECGALKVLKTEPSTDSQAVGI